MIAGQVVRRAGATVVTGVAGVAAVDVLKRVFSGGVARRGAVTVTAWGLRGARAAETGAETARLVAGDVLAEARERVGEQAPAPGHGMAAATHDHEH